MIFCAYYFYHFQLSICFFPFLFYSFLSPSYFFCPSLLSPFLPPFFFPCPRSSNCMPQYHPVVFPNLLFREIAPASWLYLAIFSHFFPKGALRVWGLQDGQSMGGMLYPHLPLWTLAEMMWSYLVLLPTSHQLVVHHGCWQYSALLWLHSVVRENLAVL